MQPGWSFRVAVLFALAAASLPLARAGSLEGTWKLVEQRYERGGHNFVREDEPVILELTAAGGLLAGQLNWQQKQAAWPAYPTPEGPATLREVQTQSSLDGDGATVSYRVEPPPGDDTWLVVTEEYRLDEDDRLTCAVNIRFERGGKLSGGFTWHRTFKRETGP